MNSIETLLGYEFKQKWLLTTALTHSSYAHEHNLESYERLEYLGDAIASFVVADFLYQNFGVEAGELTKYRAALVSTESFAQIVRSHHIDEHILAGKSIQYLPDSILADVFESVLAAIYLDGGMSCAKSFLHNFLLDDIVSADDIYAKHVDYRTRLQEVLQSFTPQKTFSFVLDKQEGGDDQKIFTMSLYIDDKKMATATGSTHKMCQQKCSKVALEQLDKISKMPK